jgi:hypothetical protein
MSRVIKQIKERTKGGEGRGRRETKRPARFPVFPKGLRW